MKEVGSRVMSSEKLVAPLTGIKARRNQSLGGEENSLEQWAKLNT